MPVMTATEREAFLADPHVAIISIEAVDRGPITVPLWYHYAPGSDVGVWMDGSSLKVRRLRAVNRFSLCVHHTERPYRYVSVEGPVLDIVPIDWARHVQPLVARYLDPAKTEAYLKGLGGPEGIRGDVWVRMQPRHWRAEVLG